MTFELSLEALALQRHGLLTRQQQTQRQYDAKRHEVAAAKGRRSWQPSVQAALERLQEKEHERSLGAFERLLSALLQDVLPGGRWVAMDLYTERGAPALDFFIKKAPEKDAPREDALNGTGGSVTNVLSAGLRLISLIRSGRRRFLVLDEADCWIKPDLVPRFASVIQQMSSDLGVQVLMISHHDESCFDAIPHRLVLTKTDDGLNAEWSVTGEIPTWTEEQSGLRSLYMENFMSHVSTFLPLSPGVTLLRGDNDIGKSAIVAALRAVFYGGKTNVNDTMIRHGENLMRVTVDLGQQRALFWERRLKGKPKEMFMMTDATHGVDNPLHRSESAKDFPAWIEEETGMGLIDGLDVQLGHQQDPIFLLNKPNSQRASALAIGSESGHVQRMIALDKSDVAQAKTQENQGEKDLELWHRVLVALAPILESQDDFETLQARHRGLQERVERGQRMQALAQRWRAAQARADVLRPMLATQAPQAPELSDLPGMHRLYRTWAQALARREAVAGWVLTTAPVVPDEPQALQAQLLVQRWRRALRTHQALTDLVQQPWPAAPAAPQAAEAQRLARTWAQAEARRTALVDLVHADPPQLPTLDPANAQRQALLLQWARAQREQAQARADMARLDAALLTHQQQLTQEFPVCPTCCRPWLDGQDPATHAHADGKESTVPDAPAAPARSSTRTLRRREI